MKTSLFALGIAATLGIGLLPATQASASLAPTTPESTAQASTAQASASAPSATRVASGDGWQVVDTSSDIDADGTIDAVSLRKRSDTVCQVKVTLGNGNSVKRALRSQWSNPCEYAGSALFDTRRGAEIKVLTGMGAHTPWDHILTYRDGELVFQRDPDGRRWTIDATVMYAKGYRRVRKAKGRIRLREDFVSRRSNGTWTGTRKVLAHQHGEWVQVARKRITRTEQQAQRLAGWHVRGFDRWT